MPNIVVGQNIKEVDVFTGGVWRKSIPYVFTSGVWKSSALSYNSYLLVSSYINDSSYLLTEYDNNGKTVFQYTTDGALVGFTSDKENNLYVIVGSLYKFQCVKFNSLRQKVYDTILTGNYTYPSCGFADCNNNGLVFSKNGFYNSTNGQLVNNNTFTSLNKNYVLEVNPINGNVTFSLFNSDGNFIRSGSTYAGGNFNINYYTLLSNNNILLYNKLFSSTFATISESLPYNGNFRTTNKNYIFHTEVYGTNQILIRKYDLNYTLISEKTSYCDDGNQFVFPVASAEEIMVEKESSGGDRICRYNMNLDFIGSLKLVDNATQLMKNPLTDMLI